MSNNTKKNVNRENKMLTLFIRNLHECQMPRRHGYRYGKARGRHASVPSPFRMTVKRLGCTPIQTSFITDCPHAVVWWVKVLVCVVVDTVRFKVQFQNELRYLTFLFSGGREFENHFDEYKWTNGLEANGNNLYWLLQYGSDITCSM